MRRSCPCCSCPECSSRWAATRRPGSCGSRGSSRSGTSPGGCRPASSAPRSTGPTCWSSPPGGWAACSSQSASSAGNRPRDRIAAAPYGAMPRPATALGSVLALIGGIGPFPPGEDVPGRGLADGGGASRDNAEDDGIQAGYERDDCGACEHEGRAGDQDWCGNNSSGDRSCGAEHGQQALRVVAEPTGQCSRLDGGRDWADGFGGRFLEEGDRL